MTVLGLQDRQARRVVSRTAHLRPVDGSGIEFTADPLTLRPADPINPDTHPKAAR